jgi:hypothetical protein
MWRDLVEMVRRQNSRPLVRPKCFLKLLFEEGCKSFCVFQMLEKIGTKVEFILLFETSLASEYAILVRYP